MLSAADERRVLDAELDRRRRLLEETAGTGVDERYRAELEAEIAVLARYLA